MTRLRRMTGLHAIALGVLVLSASAPSALAFYRCQMMATTMSSPCCAEEESSPGGAAPGLHGERCCTRVTVDVQRAPTQPTPKVNGKLPAALLVSPVVVSPASPAPAPMPSGWTGAQFDTGPPILLRVCSLLI